VAVDFDHDHIDFVPYSADQIHAVLEDLKAERELARRSSLRSVGLYMDDLEQELEAVDYLYVLTAVTEIASERAQHEGALAG
jgi:hypothetical protein